MGESRRLGLLPSIFYLPYPISDLVKHLVSITWLLLPCLAGAAQQLAILPSDIVLTGPEAQQKLLIERIRAGENNVRREIGRAHV